MYIYHVLLSDVKKKTRKKMHPFSFIVSGNQIVHVIKSLVEMHQHVSTVSLNKSLVFVYLIYFAF